MLPVVWEGLEQGLRLPGCVARVGGGQKPRSLPSPVFSYYSHPLCLFLLWFKSWKCYLSETFVGDKEELHSERGDELTVLPPFLELCCERSPIQNAPSTFISSLLLIVG